MRIGEFVLNRVNKFTKDLKEESQLPSTTYLSKEYKINIATVNKAMNILVNEGYAYKKRGIGIFVKKGAVAKLVNERRKTFRERYIQTTLVEASRLNYSLDELQQIVGEEYQKLHKK